MFGVGFDLIQYIVEDFRVNEIFGTFGLRTEAACQITYTCDLNIYFLERFQLGVPILLRGRTVPPSFVIRLICATTIISGSGAKVNPRTGLSR